MHILYLASDEVVLTMDPSEARLIEKALELLRYSKETENMTGSQLVNLAALSSDFQNLKTELKRKEQRCQKLNAILKTASITETENVWQT